MEDVAAEPRRRLAAAKLLAEFTRTIRAPQADEWHARFRKSGSFLVKQLLETAVHGTAEYEGLLQGLKPAGADLLEALQSAYHDRKQDSSLKAIALNLAATFAGDDVAALTDVVLTSADPARLDEYLPRFAADRQASVAALTAEIEGDPEQSSQPDWKDSPLDPSWSAPRPEDVQTIEAAAGMLAERFAFCQTMPLDEFVEASEALRPAGYRPVHVRPFVQQDDVLMTAIWTRDAVDWRFAHDLSAADVLKTQEEWKSDGYLPIDLAGYPRTEFRFALLAARDAELAEVDLVVGSPTATLMNEFQDRNRRGFTMLTVQASLEQNRHRHSQVWYKARTAATRHGSAALKIRKASLLLRRNFGRRCCRW